LDVAKDTPPAHKGFAPSGQIHLLFATYSKFNFKFGIFQELTTSVRCLCRAHTTPKPQPLASQLCRFVNGLGLATRYGQQQKIKKSDFDLVYNFLKEN